ncbi:tetratricopeptide repeat protein [Vreelandella nigrificans]|uniref:Sel1 repeat family protein n=1 Tax=Vreelandella nigrificans TaxID=2042704 RepID=A0A2A4HIM8_9GAMM|nr:tetratricopeptide repeat protein [Halomonas nigrificans]PCF94626.1 hypothetical protein CPA45_16415 [Halomonas nigrificans]
MRKVIQHTAAALILIPTVGAANNLEAGLAAYHAGEHETAMQELRPLAEQGDAEAQYRLGYMYNRGWGIRSNGVEALKWWHLAAEQGHLPAQYKIGDVYENSMNDSFWGIERSREEARKWYLMAAEQGYTDAQIKLGNMDPFGPEGEKWVRIAAEANNAEAQFKLGRRYQHGWGVLEDDVEAVRWFRLAAAQGYPEAQSALGSRYEFGRGVSQDDTTAYMWYTLFEANSDMTMENRRDLEAKMPPEAIAEAEQRASMCMSSNYQQGCEE